MRSWIHRLLAVAAQSVHVIHAQVLEDAVKPREEAAGRIESPDVPERVHKRVLRKIQGVVRIADIAESHVIGRLHVFLHNIRKRLTISVLASFNDRVLVG